MKREQFLTNPQAIWCITPRRYESAAEYAEAIHHFPKQQTGYPRAWWAVVALCGLAAILSMVFQ